MHTGTSQINSINNVSISAGVLSSQVYTLDLSLANTHILKLNDTTTISLELTGLSSITGQAGDIIIDTATQTIDGDIEFRGSEWKFPGGTDPVIGDSTYDVISYFVFNSSTVLASAVNSFSWN